MIKLLTAILTLMIKIIVTTIAILSSFIVKGQTSIKGDSCVQRYDVGDIPKLIKQEIKKVYHSKFIMANPKEKFQATDIISGHRLKERRLVFWIRCSNDFILLYEHGGYAYHNHVILLEKNGDSYSVVKNRSVPKRDSSLKDIRNILSKEGTKSFDHF